MTATRPSRTISAQGPHRPRKSDFVRPHQTSQPNIPKSIARQPPGSSLRATGEGPSALNMIITTPQPHQFGRAVPNENDKSQ